MLKSFTSGFALFTEDAFSKVFFSKGIKKGFCENSNMHMGTRKWEIESLKVKEFYRP